MHTKNPPLTVYFVCIFQVMEAPTLYLSCIFTLVKHNIPLGVLPVTVRGQVANFFNPYRLLDEGLNYDRSIYFYIMRFLYENTMLIRSRGLHAILPKIFLSVPFFHIVLERVETILDKPKVVFPDAWSHQGSCKHMLFLFYFCSNTSLRKVAFSREGLLFLPSYFLGPPPLTIAHKLHRNGHLMGICAKEAPQTLPLSALRLLFRRTIVDNRRVPSSFLMYSISPSKDWGAGCRGNNKKISFSLYRYTLKNMIDFAVTANPDDNNISIVLFPPSVPIREKLLVQRSKYLCALLYGPDS